MNKVKEKKFSTPLLLLLLASAVMNEYLQWILFLVLLLWYTISNLRHFFVRKMPGGFFLFCLIFQCFFVGALIYRPGARGYWPFLRDIIITTNMALCWYVASIAVDTLKTDGAAVYRTIILFSFIMSLYSIGIRFVNGTTDYSTFVESGGISGFIVSISLYLMLFKPSSIENYYFGRLVDLIIELAIVLAFVFSFSRTTLIIFLCLILCGEFDSMSAWGKIVLMLALGSIALSYFTPEILDTFLKKVMRSVTEISASNRWDDYNVVMNWRGYEVHRAELAYEKYTVLEKIFGKGFGATVDVGQFAYLVTSESALPFLHNGYYTTLIKGGVVGIVLTIGYYCFAIYHYVKLSIPKYEKRLAIGIIIAMVVSMAVIHGFFWGGAQFVVFVVLASILKNHTEREKLYESNSSDRNL